MMLSLFILTLLAFTSLTVIQLAASFLIVNVLPLRLIASF